ncbi:MAG: ribosome maturation factor RimP [Cytophagia bacterium]|nr:MAG: ribosome maturation factor RimP [Cytophagia bacterium]TAG38077.1 MAG: ribosome maturation factor RimP [Cytophagia bacterium]TAH29101.1 MAG: ribosome maturation factor RimP [Cytophagales bacterium]
MSIEKKISNYLSEILEHQYFVIDIIYKKSRTNAKLSVLLDGDAGIGIDTCVETSRKLSAWLDEQNLIEDDAYHLEVSSPGVDLPLQSMRQFPQHIGRSLEITTKEDKIVEAKLLEVKIEENKIIVLPILLKKNKKQEATESISFDYQDIKKVIVLVSFK